MVRSWYLLVLVAGCHASLGNGELDGAVPGGDARDAAASIGDRDGDGHLDNADNCPDQANADQHDEDGDHIGDVCDPCPHIAGDAADGDGDGVGDACDPQPTIAKQRLRFFDPFTSDLPEWHHDPGVARTGETLRANAFPDAYTYLAIANGETRIATAGTIKAVGTGTPHQLIITVGINSTGDVYDYGEFYDTGGATGSISLTKRNLATYTGLANASYSGILPTGPWRMQLDASVSTQRIALSAKLGTTTAELAGDTSAAPALAPSDRITLYMQNADIRFDYFVVIDTLP